MIRSTNSRLVLALFLVIILSLAFLPVTLTRSEAAQEMPAAKPNADEAMLALQGEEAVEHLKQQGTYGSLQEAMAAIKYQANWQPSPKLDGVGAAFEIVNPAHNLLAYISADGLDATGLAGGKKSWRLGLRLRGYGYGEALSVVQAGELTAKDNRVEIKRSAALTEWFINTSRGVEHGITIDTRPTTDHQPSTPDLLRLRFAVTGDLQASLDEAHDGVAFSREADGVLVSYDKLVVMDANWRRLGARMKLAASELVIEVDDGGAEYPLTIDPLLRELTKLIASDGASSDLFGWTVAVSGDTVVVGAQFDDVGGNTDQGSAYVFARSGANWSQQQKLTASDGAAGDEFGYSVGISGDTIVIGASVDDVGGNNNQGSAYVFVRGGTSWSQQSKLTASDGAANEYFGVSVAISGDTVVVGALFGAVAGQGSAYIFVHSGVTWVQQAKLTASDGAVDDRFGESVAVSGDTVVVGARDDDVGGNTEQGSAYVFVRSVTWVQQAKLTASDGTIGLRFGYSVAVSGDTVVVGAVFGTVAVGGQGSAYVFVRSGISWSQQQELAASDGAANDFFGESVAVSGDTVIVGASGDNVGANTDQGSAYVFVRSGISWSQQQQLTASDGVASDRFGFSVAVSSNTVVVGAVNDDVGANTNQGATYLFVCNWSEQALLVATSDGAGNDRFGNAVAVSGNTVVVGAYQDNVGANPDQGSAYVFVRSGVTWSQQQKLTAADGAAGDTFGVSVAISGDTIIVGADVDQVGDNPAQGSAYIFVRSGVTWSQQQQLTASDGAVDDRFGESVAVSGDTVVVGAFADDLSQGSAYVFVRSGTTWAQQQKLTAADGVAGDLFGNSVAISGDTAIVGASSDDVGFADQGSAYVFVRNGVTWTQQAQLISTDGATSDSFGMSVATSGDTVVIGAEGHDVGANGDQGSAYVFARSSDSWSQQEQLTAADGAAGDLFGNAVAISGDTVVVGAYLDDNVFTDRGSAYVFARNGGSWFEQQLLRISFPDNLDNFGTSVAVSGDTVVVGTPLDDTGDPDRGSASVFFMGCNTTPTIVASGGISIQKGSLATTSTIANVSDSEDPIGYLSVTVASAPTGILISNLLNTNGVITASIAASCSAALGNNLVTLRVQDSDGAALTVGLSIVVTANTTPTLGAYSDASVLAANSTTVIPSLAPSDNGAIVEFSATSPTFTGTLGAEPDSGNITIAHARPSGTHIITVTAIDNCGATISTGFILTVTCQAITVNPPTIPAGTAGTAYAQIFTHTGGIAPVAFILTGALPAGLSFNAGTATLSGTPTQVGSFPITVAATDRNNCAGSRNYTLTISAPILTWTGNTNSDWHTSANWTPNAVPTTYHNVLIPAAGVTNQPTIGSASSSINAMTIQSSRVLTINSSQQLSTTADITTSGTITGAGKLLFNGATFTQNGTMSLGSVEFSAGDHSLTGGGSFASGIITILGGATVTLASNHSISVIVINSGGSFDATGRALTLTGAGTAIFNSGSFTATESTLIYQGTVAQVATANIDYNDLTIDNLLGVSLSGDTTVNGQLNLMTDLTTGSFTLTMPAAGTSTGIGDVVGNVKRTGFTTGGAAFSFGNALNTIRIDSGTSPTDITVNLVKSPPSDFSNCVSRTYTITPNGGSGISATMRLRYKDSEAPGLDETGFELWRYSGTSWVSPAGVATRDTTQNWVAESGITEFSPWTIAGALGPTCGLLTPSSRFFTVRGGEGSVAVTALAGCVWTAASNVSWLQITSSEGSAGSDIVTYVVRDNLSPVPRLGTMTIAGLTFTVVQQSETASECVFNISPGFASFSAGEGTGSVSISSEEQCAWQAVSSVAWITITSGNMGIGNRMVSYSVAVNASPEGRNGTITIAGKTFAVKQKGS